MRTDSAQPRDAIQAVTHADPYPYYESLRRQAPLYFDGSLALWVASGAGVVREALDHPLLHVRPAAEPVPRNLQGTPAGEVFALLVRMNDGDFHARHKPQVRRVTGRLTPDHVAQAAAQSALDLAGRVDANQLLSAIPVQAMARLSGVPDAGLDQTVRWVHDFVQGIAPQAGADAVAGASAAAQALMAQGEAQRLDKVQSANRIALMQQALDATAGLIGNSVRCLRAQPASAPGAAPQSWRDFVAEVARFDAPVQNTRRFAAGDLLLAGQAVSQGQGVLLVLAAANRDGALNPDPDRFDARRADRRALGFGAGPHACPGEAIAIEIAAAALRTLEGAGPLDRLFGRCTGFRPLANARIPVFEIYKA